MKKLLLCLPAVMLALAFAVPATAAPPSMGIVVTANSNAMGVMLLAEKIAFINQDSRQIPIVIATTSGNANTSVSQPVTATQNSSSFTFANCVGYDGKNVLAIPIVMQDSFVIWFQQSSVNLGNPQKKGGNNFGTLELRVPFIM